MRRFGWRFWSVVVAVTLTVIIVGGLLVLWVPEGWQGYAFLGAAAITGVLTLWAYLRGVRGPTGVEKVSAQPIGAGKRGREPAEPSLPNSARKARGPTEPEVLSSSGLREERESEAAQRSYWSGSWQGEGSAAPAEQPYVGETREQGVPVQARVPPSGGPSEEPEALAGATEVDGAIDTAEEVGNEGWSLAAISAPQRELAEAHYEQGVANLSKGDCDEAIAHFSRALQLSPAYSEAWFDRGTTYAEKGDYDRAIADFDRAIELRPKDGDTHFNRGTAYLRKGDCDQALTDFDNAIGLRPDLAEAYFSRGVTRQRLGKTRRAIADFERFLRLSKDAAWRQLAEERLRELRAR